MTTAGEKSLWGDGVKGRGMGLSIGGVGVRGKRRSVLDQGCSKGAFYGAFFYG